MRKIFLNDVSPLAFDYPPVFFWLLLQIVEAELKFGIGGNKLFLSSF